MPSLLTRLIHDAQAFLSELADENTREVWEARKDEYKERLKDPALQLLDEMIGPLSREITGTVGTKLFRPHRDIRFSKDKTPYHTHFHMMWTAPSEGPAKPAWFFGISPSYMTLGAGQSDFDKATMAAWRERVATSGEDIAAIMNSLTTNGFRISDPALKRVPAPYPKEHTHEALLRRRGLTAWRDTDAGLTRDQMGQVFATLTPLMSALADLRA